METPIFLGIFRGNSEEKDSIIKYLNRQGIFRGNSEENLSALDASLFLSHHHQMNLNLDLGETLQSLVHPLREQHHLLLFQIIFFLKTKKKNHLKAHHLSGFANQFSQSSS